MDSIKRRRLIKAVMKYMEGGPSEYRDPVTNKVYSFVSDDRRAYVYFMPNWDDPVNRMMDIYNKPRLCEKYKNEPWYYTPTFPNETGFFYIN